MRGLSNENHGIVRLNSPRPAYGGKHCCRMGYILEECVLARELKVLMFCVGLGVQLVIVDAWEKTRTL